jgi:hypothetical protein
MATEKRERGHVAKCEQSEEHSQAARQHDDHENHDVERKARLVHTQCVPRPSPCS